MKRTLAALLVAFGLQVAPDASAGGGGGKPQPVKRYTTVAEAIDGLVGCSGKAWSMCSAYVELESYGAKAVPELLAAVKIRKEWEVTHAGLELLVDYAPKSTGVGMQLVTLADGVSDDHLAGLYYKAAVKIDRQRAFDALAAHYQANNTRRCKEPANGTERVRALLTGMAELRAPALAFVAAQLPRAKDPVALADLAVLVASAEGDRERLAEMVKTTRDRRAQIRLAGGAIKIGLATDALFDVMHAGLTSDDTVLRTETRERFTARKMPAHLAAKFRSVFEAHAKTAKMDRSLASHLLFLGSTDRAAFEQMFGGFTSKRVSDRIMAAMAIRTHAPTLALELAVELDKRVTEALVSATGAFHKKLTEGQVVLRSALAGGAGA